jgi:hypothetical protein
VDNVNSKKIIDICEAIDRFLLWIPLCEDAHNQSRR